jgi:hypothetical protein
MLLEYFKLLEIPEKTLIEWQRQLNSLVPIISGLMNGKARVTAITATTTLNEDYYGIVICNSATPIDVVFPTAVDKKGLGYRIVNINTGTATLLPDGSETLQRQVSIALAQDDSISFTSDNVNWYES